MLLGKCTNFDSVVNRVEADGASGDCHMGVRMGVDDRGLVLASRVSAVSGVGSSTGVRAVALVGAFLGFRSASVLTLVGLA